MGRIHDLDERGEHEGHIVGYVPRHWVPSGTATAIGSSRPVAALEHYSERGGLRELGMLEADHAHDIHGICVIGYACACGWRSPYRELGTPLEWSPSVIHWTDWLEDSLARRWWEPHVHDVVRAAREPEQPGASGRVEIALELSDEGARSLLAFLDSVGSDDFDQLTQHLGVERAQSANAGLCALGEELELQLREHAPAKASAASPDQVASEPKRERSPVEPRLRVIGRGESRTAAVGGEVSKSAGDPSARNDVIAIHNDHAAIAGRFIAEIERQRRKQAATSEQWGTESAERMRRLCRAFPTLRGVPGTDPWNAMHLLEWLCTSGAVTTGSRHAAKFVLQVWNNSTDWAELARQSRAEEGLGLADVELAPFNVVQALATWDAEHESAFRTWCELPFWS